KAAHRRERHPAAHRVRPRSHPRRRRDPESTVHRAGPDRSGAHRAARRQRQNRRSPSVIAAETLSGPTPLDLALDRYLSHLRVERGLLPATLESYARDLREYMDWLARRGLAQLSQVTEPVVLQHIAALQVRGLSRASQARHLAALRGLHRFANAEGLTPLDPSEGVGAVRGTRPLPHFLSVGDVDRLLSQPQESTAQGVRDRAVLVVFSATC